MASADVATTRAKATLIDNLIIVSSNIVVLGKSYHEFGPVTPRFRQQGKQVAVLARGEQAVLFSQLDMPEIRSDQLQEYVNEQRNPANIRKTSDHRKISPGNRLKGSDARKSGP